MESKGANAGPEGSYSRYITCSELREGGKGLPSCPAIYILFDNREWLAPLHEALQETQDTPFVFVSVAEGVVDTRATPPRGVFFCRVSPSSHTRGQRWAIENCVGLVRWLESHERRVINGSSALRLESSKVLQELALQKAGISSPATVAIVGKGQLLDFLRKRVGAGLRQEPFLLKHNRGGSGAGVRLFGSHEAALEYVESHQFEEPVDGITLVQDYIDSDDKCLYRLEFVGGRFLYAVRVDTSSFQAGEVVNNCPSDSCQFKPGQTSHKATNCPLKKPVDKFQVQAEWRHPVIARIEAMAQNLNLGTFAFEVVLDSTGRAYVIDCNCTNTNYSLKAENKIGRRLWGATAIAQHLNQELLHEDNNNVTPGRKQAGQQQCSGKDINPAQQGQFDSATVGLAAFATGVALSLMTGRNIARLMRLFR